MIPKVIHYCWFGGNPLPASAQKCIESWKKYCVGYEIREWNESNFDVESCDYGKEAYKAGKWAFVSDYARFKILYENGGIYFDTDVELLKPIDSLIETGSFMGREDDAGNSVSVNPGLGLAASSGLGLYKEILCAYDNRHFIKRDGSIDCTTVVTFTTEILKKHGLKAISGVQQIEGIYIYPKEYFCPKSYVTLKTQITENTYAIHHFDASWHTEEDDFAMDLKRKFRMLRLGKAGGYLANFIAAVRYKGMSAAIQRVFVWSKREK